MSAYEKGKQSREEIINASRQIFNEEGINLTLVKLAKKMNMTLGRLTHHFKNKDLLFIGIAQDYEDKLRALRQRRQSNQISFNTFITGVSQVMDLEFEYRCAIRYVVSSLRNRDEMKSHILKTYVNNRDDIRKTFEALVQVDSLQSTILRNDVYEVFLFQLTNMLTNWVINLELYDVDKTYADVKPVYLKGIISIFLPFLTDKGKRELEQNSLIEF